MSTRSLIGLFLVGFLVSSFVLPCLVEGQELIELTIKSDGSIEPETALLDRNGSVYTLKNDIHGSIKVEAGYLTLDGAGQTLQDNYLKLAKGTTPRTNILVKNLRISGGHIGLYAHGSSNNTLVGNYFENISVAIIPGCNRSATLFKHDTFKNTDIIISYYKAGIPAVFTENNFVGDSGFCLWMTSVSPVVDRNYWSNYTAKYPNATELAGSGIWDTPYVSEVLGGTIIDEHPLVHPVTEFEIADFNVSTAVLTPYSVSPNAIGSNLLSGQTVLTLIVGVAVTAIILVILLTVFRSKYRGGPTNS